MKQVPAKPGKHSNPTARRAARVYRTGLIILLAAAAVVVVGAGAYLLEGRSNREPLPAPVVNPPSAVNNTPVAKEERQRPEEARSVMRGGSEGAATDRPPAAHPSVKRTSSGSNKSPKPVRQIAIPG